MQKEEVNGNQEIPNLKSEIRKQGNMKIMGPSTNQMKKKLNRMNRNGVIPPPPPPTSPGEVEEIPPPPAPFKQVCTDKCCTSIGTTTVQPTGANKKTTKYLTGFQPWDFSKMSRLKECPVNKKLHENK